MNPASRQDCLEIVKFCRQCHEYAAAKLRRQQRFNSFWFPAQFVLAIWSAAASCFLRDAIQITLQVGFAIFVPFVIYAIGTCAARNLSEWREEWWQRMKFFEKLGDSQL